MLSVIVSVLSVAVVVLALTVWRFARKSAAADRRSIETERKLAAYMAALDIITTPPKHPDHGRRLRIVPSIGAPLAASWMAKAIKESPGRTAAVVAVGASAGFLTAVWPPTHAPSPAISMPARRPPAATSPAPPSVLPRVSSTRSKPQAETPVRPVVLVVPTSATAPPRAPVAPTPSATARVEVPTPPVAVPPILPLRQRGCVVTLQLHPVITVCVGG